VLASWFYRNLLLFSFVLHSFLPYHVGDDLRYTCYGETRVSAELAEVLLTHSSLLGMLMFKELQVKGSIVVQHYQATHPLLN